MAFDHYIRSGSKMLRCGYTTGTTAALAASGAASFAATGKCPDEVTLMTAKGIRVTCSIEESGTSGGRYYASVRKDGGDDIDVTNGILIYAYVKLTDDGEIKIDGGKGVGRVTKPGLDQPVGNAAINSVPRKMIERSVREAIEQAGLECGADVTIEIPEGEKVAEKTFNPNLGVEGGISVIGTSGIVEPMSEKALIDTIEIEMRQKAEESEDLIITPGNYGESYLKGSGLAGIDVPVLKFSNYLGDTLDMASQMGFKRVLLVSHIGKLIKVAGAIMNTHSKYADSRNEIFACHAALSGCGTEVIKRIMDSATTDSIIEILDEEGVREKVMESVLAKVQEKLDHRAAGAYETGAVTFSNVYGFLGETGKAREIINELGGKE